MKLFLVTIFVICSIPSVVADVVRLSEPVMQDADSETFGAVLDTSRPISDLALLLNEPDKKLGLPFVVKTRISKVCQRKGCFFIAQQDHHIVRVSFKDYGFFIPTDSNGKTVLLSGELIKKELSAEQAEHFSADLKAAKQAIKPGVVYEIVADSIRIPKS